MGLVITTFPMPAEFTKAKKALDDLRLSCEVIRPEPAYVRVGAAGVVVDSEARMVLAARHRDDYTCSGWVDYRPAAAAVPREAPKAFEDDVFGEAAIMVLAPCVADTSRIRIIAHLSGDLGKVFPYLNTVMTEASYNVNGPIFTFMEGYRMVSMSARRIAVAKADEIVDAWRTLEMIRCLANETWANRANIEPSYEMRQRPCALEIYKRLPGTNCKACGEETCLAFALRLWNSDASPSQCRPVFEGQYRHLKPAFLEICAGLGVSETAEPGVTK